MKKIIVSMVFIKSRYWLNIAFVYSRTNFWMEYMYKKKTQKREKKKENWQKDDIITYIKS